KPNRWKGFVLGVIASQVALIAMTYYQVKVAPAVAGERSRQSQSVGREGESGEAGHGAQGAKEGGNSTEKNKHSKEYQSQHGPPDSISLSGKHYKDGETSTAALGRMTYRFLTGKEPSAKETQETLSYLVHWLYGILMGGVYGAVRGGVRFPDLV